jgi:sortase (surface protein transpeptidase)
VTFRNGGILNPPETALAAGISARNQPLASKKGVTVLTWHVRYGPGCDGALNDLITLPIGSTFTVGAVDKTPRWYKIVKRETVPKGKLKRYWFRHDGKKRLVLITCADYAGGVFRRTMGITAVPIPAPVPTTAPVPTPTASPVPAPSASTAPA